MSNYFIQYLEDVDELVGAGKLQGSFGGYFDTIDLSIGSDVLEEKVRNHFGDGRQKIDTRRVQYIISQDNKVISSGYIVVR